MASKKTLTALLIGSLAVYGITKLDKHITEQCARYHANPPSRIITNGLEHVQAIRDIIGPYHGGAVKIGLDKDIDHDNMNDYYVVMADKTVWNTASRRLIQGEDHITRRTWERNTMYNLKHSEKGGYEAR